MTMETHEPVKPDMFKMQKAPLNINWPHLDLRTEVESKQHTVNKSQAPTVWEKRYRRDTPIWTCPWPSWAKQWETQATKALRLDFIGGAKTISQPVKWSKRQNRVLWVQSTPDKSQWTFLQFMGSSPYGWGCKHGRNIAWMINSCKRTQALGGAEVSRHLLQLALLPQTHQDSKILRNNVLVLAKCIYKLSSF